VADDLNSRLRAQLQPIIRDLETKLDEVRDDDEGTAAILDALNAAAIVGMREGVAETTYHAATKGGTCPHCGGRVDGILLNPQFLDDLDGE
jgi:hypothetical protein